MVRGVFKGNVREEKDVFEVSILKVLLENLI